MFENFEFPSTTMVPLATYNLKGRAVIWWGSVRNKFRAKKAVRGELDVEMTWSMFTGLFQEQYLSDAIWDLRQTQFENIA